MNVIKWNPWREMDTFSDRFNRFFDGTFLPAVWLKDESALRNWAPVVDIEEDSENILVKAEIPGMTKEDVKVSVQGNILTITGERKQDTETKNKTFHRVERSYGKFSRMITLPTDVEADKVKANYKDGILSITLPKPEAVKPKHIDVEIK